jgi:hypothetical protein
MPKIKFKPNGHRKRPLKMLVAPKPILGDLLKQTMASTGQLLVLVVLPMMFSSILPE